MASGDDYQIWVPPNAVLRERAQVRGVSIDGLKYVLGYLKPRYIEYMDDGRRVAELHARDLDRVKDGYACGDCLAFFAERFPACPGCGHELDAQQDVVEHHPDYWDPSPGRTSDEILRERF